MTINNIKLKSRTTYTIPAQTPSTLRFEQQIHPIAFATRVPQNNIQHKCIIKRYFMGELSRVNAMSLCGYNKFTELLNDARSFGLTIPFNNREINRIVSLSLQNNNFA